MLNAPPPRNVIATNRARLVASEGQVGEAVKGMIQDLARTASRQLLVTFNQSFALAISSPR